MPDRFLTAARYLTCVLCRSQAALLSMVVAGCVIAGHVEKTPTFEEFGDSQLSYRVRGAPKDVVAQVEDFLTKRYMPSIVLIRSPNTYVITSYFEEPHEESDRRLRETAFRIGISGPDSVSQSDCTTVLVSVLTKSRGIHEEVWSVQEADSRFRSTALPQIKEAFLKEAC